MIDSPVVYYKALPSSPVSDEVVRFTSIVAQIDILLTTYHVHPQGVKLSIHFCLVTDEQTDRKLRLRAEIL